MLFLTTSACALLGDHGPSHGDLEEVQRPSPGQVTGGSSAGVTRYGSEGVWNGGMASKTKSDEGEGEGDASGVCGGEDDGGSGEGYGEEWEEGAVLRSCFFSFPSAISFPPENYGGMLINYKF